MSIYLKFSQFLRFLYSSVDTPPVLDQEALFPKYRELSEHLPDLQREAAVAGAEIRGLPKFHELMRSQKSLSDADGKDWRMFILRSYGQDVPANLAKAPYLAQFLSENPDVLSAAFSYLEPGKHIPPHRGPFRGIARYHICVHIEPSEKESCLILDGVKHPYGDGSWLLWDDTYTHAVQHHDEGWRVALLLDVRRRDLGPVLTGLSTAIIRGIGFYLAVKHRGMAQT
ncbi:MAG TPA: aspartyl/asparaginyl beta-hydroxylase domain-containing protein [Paracoccaceae bacterium]|nr:aspartyl/asparaginyl beta-hydroxylase domain-containing protein [Paracoccaceae bacterium]